MKKRFLFLFLISGLVLMNACQREYSLESGNTPSEGSLQDDGAGDCLPKTVAGAYVVNVALVGTTNFIEVQVNVTKVGTYTIYTDTVNGMYFRASGAFTATGLFTVQLKGNGTPLATGISNFIVTYGISGCTIAVTTVGSLAVFTLDGAPGGCMGAAVAGTYTALVALNATNNVTINVNVTTPGAYNITTLLSNGMTFSGSGVFAIAGAQAIVLTGSGIPAASGTTPIPVSTGSSNCSFPVTVGAAAGAAVFTINCASAAVVGTCTVGTALTAAANTITLTVDVATAGTYSITGTINGMTFSSAPGASFAAAGAGQTVTLTGSGNPTTQGPNTLPLTGATAACNVTVNVNAAPPGAAVFTVNCASPTVNGTYIQGTALTASNTVTLSVNVTTAGTYNITTTITNGITFNSGAGTWATGAQTLTLTGSGTPTASGTIYIPINAGVTPCSFLILVANTSTDYYPRVTNNNWSYEFDDVAGDSIYRKVIATPFSALGNTYSIFMFDDGSGFDSSGYYRKNGGDYFEYLDVGSFIGFDNPAFAEYTMLKDNVAAGTNWKSAGFSGTVTIPPPQSLTLRFSYTILQKDVPVTITSSATGSITYQNVIVVEEKYEQFTGGTWVDVTSLIDFYGKSYYARGIGLIKYEPLNAAGVVQQGKMELRRYVVY